MWYTLLNDKMPEIIIYNELVCSYCGRTYYSYYHPQTQTEVYALITLPVIILCVYFFTNFFEPVSCVYSNIRWLIHKLGRRQRVYILLGTCTLISYKVNGVLIIGAENKL